MLSELKAVDNFKYVVLARFLDVLENLRLNDGIVDIGSRALADFDSHYLTIMLHILALEHLAESSSTKNLLHDISITKLLVNLGLVALVSLLEVEVACNSLIAYRVNLALKVCDLMMLKVSQNRLIALQSLLNSETLNG